MSRCLYNSSFEKFINADENSIFGALCDNYHGDALTTTREAWKAEISIIKCVLSNYVDKNGQVIFEYKNAWNRGSGFICLEETFG